MYFFEEVIFIRELSIINSLSLFPSLKKYMFVSIKKGKINDAKREIEMPIGIIDTFMKLGYTNNNCAGIV